MARSSDYAPHRFTFIWERTGDDLRFSILCPEWLGGSSVPVSRTFISWYIDSVVPEV